MFKQKKKGNQEGKTYPMAPSGEDSLGITAVCFPETSIAGISESLTLRIHFRISM